MFERGLGLAAVVCLAGCLPHLPNDHWHEAAKKIREGKTDEAMVAAERCVKPPREDGAEDRERWSCLGIIAEVYARREDWPAVVEAYEKLSAESPYPLRFDQRLLRGIALARTHQPTAARLDLEWLAASQLDDVTRGVAEHVLARLAEEDGAGATPRGERHTSRARQLLCGEPVAVVRRKHEAARAQRYFSHYVPDAAWAGIEDLCRAK